MSRHDEREQDPRGQYGTKHVCILCVAYEVCSTSSLPLLRRYPHHDFHTLQGVQGYTQTSKGMLTAGRVTKGC
jgi:hypothetical protein